MTKNRKAISSLCNKLGYSSPDFSFFGDGSIYGNIDGAEPDRQPATSRQLSSLTELVYALIDHLGLEISVPSKQIVIRKRNVKDTKKATR